MLISQKKHTEVLCTTPQYQWKKPNSTKQTGKWLNNVPMNPSGKRYWFWVITCGWKLSYLEQTVVLIYQQEKKRASPKIPVKPLVLENKQWNGLLVLRGTQMEIAEWRSLQRKAGKVSLAFAHFAGDSHKPRGNSPVVNPSKRASALCFVFLIFMVCPCRILAGAEGLRDPRWSVREVSLQRVGF